MKADPVNPPNASNEDIKASIPPASSVPPVPSSSRISPPRISLWNKIFRMVAIEWVNDFLFATDGTTHASMLLSPCQETNSLLMTTSATELTGEPSVAVSVSSHWLLFPIYSVAGTSVGLVVQEEISDDTSPRLTRYVRCDDTGETLMITDVPEGGLEMEYVCYNSAFSSTRMFCLFDQQLRPYLRSRNINIDDNIVKLSLIRSVTLKERRASCILCNLSAPKCACKVGFQFRRARHPTDFQYVVGNTLPILGDFRGNGTTIDFVHGLKLYSKPTTTDLRTISGGTVGTTERLQFWAARFLFEQAKPNPLMLEMPPVGMSAATEEMVNGFLCDDPDSSVEKTDSLKVPTKRTVVKKEKKEEERPIEMGKPAMWEMPLCASTAKPDVGIDCLPAPTNITPPLVPMPPTTPKLLPATVAIAPVTISPVQRMPVPIMNGVPGAPGLPIQYGGVRGAIAVSPNSPVLLPIPMPLVPLPVQPNGNTNIPQKRRWTAIAPSAVPTENVEQYTSAERRKIMKREAAARSNAKRRELVALQRKLTKAKSKVETLRKREEELRIENTELRRATAVG